MKRPYYVPTMAEIAAIPSNGLTHVSTFSGGGGSVLGYEMAGFATRWANEWDSFAQQAFALNFPNVYLDKRDIRDVKVEDILRETGLGVGEIDVFEASPPCTRFSGAGPGMKGWGGKERIEELSFEVVRLVDGLRTRAFTIENVPAWGQGVNAPYMWETRSRFKKLGYHVSTSVLDASRYGVPQARHRLIMIGVRDDLGIEPQFPPPVADRYTFRDAVPGISRQSGYEFYRVRLINPDKPAPTIMASGSALHACIDGVVRQLTIAEVKRVCSFPDDYQLDGPGTEQWRRLGNAVPPLLARAVACAVRDMLLKIDARRIADGRNCATSVSL